MTTTRPLEPVPGHEITVTDDRMTDTCWGCPFMRHCPRPGGCPYRGGDYGPADEQPVKKTKRKEASFGEDARHQT